MGTYFNDLSIAPTAAEDCRRIRITHPFHPLTGKQFELVEHRCIFAESYVYFHADHGHLREIPALWTDFANTDAFAERLLELADLVVRWREDQGHSM